MMTRAVAGSIGDAVLTKTPQSSLPHGAMSTCAPSRANHKPIGSATASLLAHIIAIVANIPLRKERNLLLLISILVRDRPPDVCATVR